jgi:hypothetical protein
MQCGIHGPFSPCGIFEYLLCLCTVDFRERGALFLPFHTYVFLEEPVILKPSKGCCGRQPGDKQKVCCGRRTRNGLLQNLLKRISPHGSSLLSYGAFFVVSNLKEEQLPGPESGPGAGRPGAGPEQASRTGDGTRGRERQAGRSEGRSGVRRRSRGADRRWTGRRKSEARLTPRSGFRCRCAAARCWCGGAG